MNQLFDFSVFKLIHLKEAIYIKTLFEFNGRTQISDLFPRRRNDVFHFVLKRKNRKKSGNMKDVIPSNSLFKTFYNCKIQVWQSKFLIKIIRRKTESLLDSLKKSHSLLTIKRIKNL